MGKEDENSNGKDTSSVQSGTLPDRAEKRISSSLGGMAGAVGTLLVIVIPVVNTWLSNAKEISLAQIKNSAEQIAYIERRCAETDKERDLYRNELTSVRMKANELEDKLHSCKCPKP